MPVSAGKVKKEWHMYMFNNQNEYYEIYHIQVLMTYFFNLRYIHQISQWFSTHKIPMHLPSTLVVPATRKFMTMTRLFSASQAVISGSIGKIGVCY
jgi:hypothetical protein